MGRKNQHASTSPGDCTFLGTKGRLDLYFGPLGLTVPVIIARSGSGPSQFKKWPVDRGPSSTVLMEAFLHAVRLALQQGLLELK